VFSGHDHVLLGKMIAIFAILLARIEQMWDFPTPSGSLPIGGFGGLLEIYPEKSSIPIE